MLCIYLYSNVFSKYTIIKGNIVFYMAIYYERNGRPMTGVANLRAIFLF
jgi:hypothetical protein